MFQNNKEYIIKNDWIEISPLKLQDLNEQFNISNDKNIWKHFTENGYGRDNFESYINTALENRNKNSQYPMVIRDLRRHHIVGMTRLYEIDNELKNLKIGHSCLGNSLQETRINKMCKYLLFEFVFEVLGFERIGFCVSALNKRSINALKSVGCQIEGELRHFLPVSESSERISIILLSILKAEWDSGIKTQLLNKINKFNKTEL